MMAVKDQSIISYDLRINRPLDSVDI